MASSAAHLFEQLAEPREVPAFAAVTGSYRFDIANVGSWVVRVDHGKITAIPGKGDADIVARGDEEDVVAILEGRRNMLTMYMQGRLGIAGDLELLPEFFGCLREGGGLLPSPAPTPHTTQNGGS